MSKKKNNENEKDKDQKLQKIAAIREMIANAERTIASARAMLAQIEGKSVKKSAPIIPASEEGEVVKGVFDGQVMIGTDGKQYPVPANYASKSKLVEGDMLKLTITPDGSFVYKQIGPVERKRVIGIVSQDDLGNYVVIADGKAYRVLLASITYFKAEPGDEVTLVIPRDSESVWGAIENLVKKGTTAGFATENFEKKEIQQEKKESARQTSPAQQPDSSYDSRHTNANEEERIVKRTEDYLGQDGKLESDFTEEWTPELKKLRKEASKPIA